MSTAARPFTANCSQSEAASVSSADRHAVTHLEVFLTLVRVICRPSGMGSGAMTAARLFLTSGAASLLLREGNSVAPTSRHAEAGRVCQLLLFVCLYL